ncbi:MAG: ABC transporter permease [Clostridiales bacterium]|jgi:ABC-type dipeptide/oligopeptide/nickel transport system permease component|nr:ABC transporter permease [Clostridiales bacterium]
MDTLKYTLKRLGLMLLTLFIIFTIIFVLIKLLPTSLYDSLSAADKAKWDALGYNNPIIVQYGTYLKNIITRWDWGYSWNIKLGQTSTSLFLDRMVPTVLVNLFSFIIAVPIGLLLGILIAQKKNKWQDQVYGVVIIFFIALPSFVFAFLLQYFLAFQLGWLPIRMEPINLVSGWFDPLMLLSMVLPVLAMAIPIIASTSRSVRAELSEQLGSEYMLLARAKGLTKRQATFRHCFKNAMVPILPILIGMFILNFSAGSIVIERIFSIPGTGLLYLDALTTRDYDVFMVVSMFFVFASLLSGLVSDLSFSYLDPRIKVR